MRDAKPYWNKPNRDAGDPVYLEHFLLFEAQYESGKWESFCVDYKPDGCHEGGKYTEFYWNGDLQGSFPFCVGTQQFYKEQLNHFVEFWLDEYDWGYSEKSG